MRVALTWFTDHQDGSGLSRLTGALFGYWSSQGLYGEGQMWLDRALAYGDVVPPLVRLRTLGTAGALALVQGDYADAARLSADELPLAWALANEANESRLLVASSTPRFSPKPEGSTTRRNAGWGKPPGEQEHPPASLRVASASAFL